MAILKDEWIDAAREAIARLRRGSDGAKVAVAVGLIVVAGVVALASGPRREKPLAEILTLVSRNDIEAVRAAARSSPKVLKEVDFDGNTPLHIAAMSGSTEMVAALLGAGADVTAKNRHGWTPLVAALNGSGHQAAVARALIAGGAPKDERLEGGDTLLHVAASMPDLQPKVVAVLADGPASADARNDAGETPLDVAQRAGRPRMVQALRRLRGEVVAGETAAAGAGAAAQVASDEN